ncbi:MAG: MalY/PatB family protein [Alphaproteobacteria bacterium]|jgi:cystathionine beta-lyase|nr:MalY/PatB family protein [Alphaproteobacteria bacterium]MDP6815723.1 MalY/PatB family protein [Alphaproteobacteria bacterium]
MKYDFDRIATPRGIGSVKWEHRKGENGLEAWDATEEKNGRRQVLPMWVADMDFAIAEPIRRALAARANIPSLGYTYRTDAYLSAVTGWMRRRHGWTVEPDWIAMAPGVVPSLNMLVRTFTQPGDGVILQPPVYHPFYMVIDNNDARVVRNPLRLVDGRYEMDFDDLEAKAADPAVKMLLLCSPHNPVGRVWSEAELSRLGEICNRHEVLVVADELHADLMLYGSVFQPYAALGQAFADNTVVCSAASKTFSLAGMHTANIITPNPALREQVAAGLRKAAMFGSNPFGAAAVQAAYDEGEDWLEQALAYIQGNVDFMAEFLAEHLPQIRLIKPQATYLVWLDCRALGLDQAQLEDLTLNKAGLYLDEGYIFGEEGAGFERINVACPRAILADAMHRLANAVGP